MSQGVVRRKDKEMSREEAEAFLGRARMGHIGSVGPDGQP
jgi:nitroimidazol reductase NimA-like FMN-containing flavoprotein (pyridoxamine 5'-phosphate oxidase superfamily)